jgi:hypothetical protein
MVPFVKDLVALHIKKKNTLIVVTIPMPGTPTVFLAVCLKPY